LGTIFISYRRQDCSGYVRALLNEINRTFGDEAAFLDMASIEAGTDFAHTIDTALRASEVLLVIIGPQWLHMTDGEGQRRLDQVDDFVRLEIQSALQQGIPTIPVLVESTPMPGEEQLPECLAPLARLQALKLSHERWNDDIRWLLRAIETVTEEPRLSRSYLQARQLARQGQWRAALEIYEDIVRQRADFRDSAERLQPLRDLAEQTARLGPGHAGWLRIAGDFPVVAMVVLGLLPNILAGAFNYVYNWQIIVHPMQLRGVVDAESLFERTSMLVNGLAFALAIFIFVRLTRPLARVLRSQRAGDLVGRYLLAQARQRCLRLAHWVALLGAGMWLAAGPVYPALIGSMLLRDYAFFTASLFFCGLIAAAYPFFGVAWLCTQFLHAELMPPGSALESDQATLQALEGRSWQYLALAGSLPMLAIAAGLMLSPWASSTANAVLLGTLGVAGFVGFLAAIAWFRAIQRNLRILRDLVRYSTPRE